MSSCSGASVVYGSSAGVSGVAAKGSNAFCTKKMEDFSLAEAEAKRDASCVKN